MAAYFVILSSFIKFLSLAVIISIITALWDPQRSIQKQYEAVTAPLGRF